MSARVSGNADNSTYSRGLIKVLRVIRVMQSFYMSIMRVLKVIRYLVVIINDHI